MKGPPHAASVIGDQGLRHRGQGRDNRDRSDFLFDQTTWSVRWLVVDTGKWLTGRKVLVHPSAIDHVDHERRQIDVALTGKQVEDSPDIGQDRPVSQQTQNDLYSYYGWDPLWNRGMYGAGLYGGGLYSGWAGSTRIGTWCARNVPSILSPSMTFGPVQPFGERSTIMGQRGRVVVPEVRAVRWKS